MQDKRAFKCALCEELFVVEDGWTDADSEEQFKKEFPDADINDTAVVCDDCYQLIIKQQNVVDDDFSVGYFDIEVSPN